jgi:hypothetical protein
MCRVGENSKQKSFDLRCGDMMEFYLSDVGKHRKI